MESKNSNKATVIPNGPLVIEGNFMVKGIDGNIMNANDKIYLCQCGQSSNKPLCDGSHKNK